MSLDIARRRVLKAALPATTIGVLSSLADLAQARTDTAPQRMPVLFIGHGSPMNALQDNDFTRTLRGWRARWREPKAMLVVSAHWLTPGSTAVTVFEGFQAGTISMRCLQFGA